MTLKPFEAGNIYHFTYNLDTRVVEQHEDLYTTYGLEQFYENMPYGFAENNVYEEDRAAYIKMYESIHAGAPFATCDFRVKGSEIWSRVNMFRESMDSPIVKGYVLDVTLPYGYAIEQEKGKEQEHQQRVKLELDQIRLLSAVHDAYDMVMLANLTRNTYRMLNRDPFINHKAEHQGVFDDLIAFGVNNVPKEFQDDFYNHFSREALLKAREEGKKDVYLEHQHYGDDGVPSWITTHVIFVEDTYNGDILEITLCQNINERVRKEEEQQRIRKDLELEAMQLMSGIVGTFDILISSNLSTGTFKLKQYDRRAGKMLEDEGSYEELMRVGVDRVPEEQREAFLEAFCRESMMQAYEEGRKDVYLEHQQYNEYGELHWLATHAFFTENPYSDDILTITLSQNIDERRNKEAEQMQMLSDALRLAESANRAKSDFLSRMSHDIRTPMNAVIGYATIAASHPDEKERVKDSLRKILSSGEHLQGLINDVLDMSRIEAGKESLNLSRVSIPEMIRTVLPMIHTQITQKHIELYVDTIDLKDEYVYADAQKMRQLLLNILGNAAKFTSDGGRIAIKIRQSASRKAGHAVYTFFIKDTGIGMSKEFQAHLFETFSQERTSTNSKQLGTGLGMAIAKNYVDMMGGTITVESEVGKGTEFAVKIEFKLQEDVKPDVRLDQLKGYRALVVDDDFQCCDSVVHLLRDIGMRADFTTTGKEALFRTQMAYADGDSYFAYIIDWIMPDMNGIELVRRIRKIIGDDVPIIILTAYYWGDIEQEAREAGVTAFCTKPLFTSDLTGIFLQHDSIVVEQESFENERVLLVEDNDFNREIAEFMLKDIGFEVEIACDGQDAVAMMEECEDGRYDYVLMDVQMPIMNGIEATKEIRRSDREYLRTVPIIALTANAFVEDADRCIAAGMNAHLAKPFRIEEIIAVIKTFKKSKY